MALSTIASLFAIMAVLAALPSTSVFTVVSRSMTSGFAHGFATATGVVIGDIVFIVIAVYGLSVIADTLGSLFILVKYLAGAYLIWFGIQLWKVKTDAVQPKGTEDASLLSSFLCGLFITLGDQKAILFYMGFFPAFLDLSSVSVSDISIVVAVTIVAVGGVKVIYALVADRSRLLFKNAKAKKALNIFAGSAMIGTGIFLVTKA